MHRDPEGYYARLGLGPSAGRAAIVAAYRREARRLHPDVPGTGSVEAFVALQAAYDVLRDPVRRRAYDAAATPPPARAAPARSGGTEDVPPAVATPAASWLDRRLLLWIGFLVASSAAAAWLMLTIASGPTAGLPAPGPAPPPAAETPAAGADDGTLPRARTSGPADHYVLPGFSAATVWQSDPGGGRLRSVAALPAFTPVQVLGLAPGDRLAAIRLAGGDIGFVAAARLAPGDSATAYRAACADRAGPAPDDGAVLARAGRGAGRFAVRNRGAEPAVVKLRDGAGRVVRSVYLAPGAAAALHDLPGTAWTVEIGVGELWSQACGLFAAGERAQRFPFALGSGSVLAIPPDLPERLMPVDIGDRTFARP